MALEVFIQRTTDDELQEEPISPERFACVTFCEDGICFNVWYKDGALHIECSSGPLAIQAHSMNKIVVYEAGFPILLDNYGE